MHTYLVVRCLFDHRWLSAPFWPQQPWNLRVHANSQEKEPNRKDGAPVRYNYLRGHRQSWSKPCTNTVGAAGMEKGLTDWGAGNQGATMGKRTLEVRISKPVRLGSVGGHCLSQYLFASIWWDLASLLRARQCKAREPKNPRIHDSANAQPTFHTRRRRRVAEAKERPFWGSWGLCIGRLWAFRTFGASGTNPVAGSPGAARCTLHAAPLTGRHVH